MFKLKQLFYILAILLISVNFVSASGSCACGAGGSQCFLAYDSCDNGESCPVNCDVDWTECSTQDTACVPEFSDYMGIVALVATISIVMLYTKLKKRK